MKQRFLVLAAVMTIVLMCLSGCLSEDLQDPKAPDQNTPDSAADLEVLERLRTFFSCWALNRQDDMLTLCSPAWAAGEEDPKTALSELLADRTPKDYREEDISGTADDTGRTVTVLSLMDLNNGEDPVRYRLEIIMEKEEDGLWYVNPGSLVF